MSDLIDRQSAIEALLDKGQSSHRYKLGETWELNFGEIKEAIESVPSVQPNLHLNLQPTCNQLATDCVSRQEAIDALNEYFARIGKLKGRGLNKGEKAISLDIVGVINSLPSAQPEIIRCKDCKHAHDHDCPVNWGRTDDDYCSWGER